MGEKTRPPEVKMRTRKAQPSLTAWAPVGTFFAGSVLVLSVIDYGFAATLKAFGVASVLVVWALVLAWLMPSDSDGGAW